MQFLTLMLVHCECGYWVHDRSDLEPVDKVGLGNINCKHRDDLVHFNIKRRTDDNQHESR
jgi:hypothetical protein